MLDLSLYSKRGGPTLVFGLKPGSVDSFDGLVRSFITHFVSRQKHRRTLDYLVSIKQKEGESLHSYLDRFNTAILEVRNLDQSVAMTALKGGLQRSKLRFSLQKTYPKSWLALRSTPMLKRMMMPFQN